MKKCIAFTRLFYVLLISLVFASCSIDDDKPVAREYFLPTVSVDGPETMVLGQTAVIDVTFSRPNECYIFNGYYYTSGNMTRNIAVKGLVFNEEPCANDEESTFEAPLNFQPSQLGTYTLKFWTGYNANGEAEYLEYSIDVTN